MRWAAGGSDRRQPLRRESEGTRGQNNGHYPAAPSHVRGGTPPGRTRGSDAAAAGQGDVKRLDREHGKPRKQARGLTQETPAAFKAAAQVQRVDKGKRRRKETEARAARRAAVDLALLEMMRDGLRAAPRPPRSSGESRSSAPMARPGSTC